jgi:hypothetical protein
MGIRYSRALALTLLLVGWFGFLVQHSILAQDSVQPGQKHADKTDLLKHEFSDPDLWRFEGVQSFSIRQIKSAVTSSIEFLRASHPNSKDAELSAAIRTVVARGYHHRGFANVRLNVQIDRPKRVVHIQVNEGPKFRAGAIVVTGAKNLSVDRFVQWCQRGRPVNEVDFTIRINSKKQATQLRNRDGRFIEPKSKDLAAVKEPTELDPVWEKGGSRSLLKHTQEYIKKYLPQGFEDQGFYHVEFEFQVVADQASKTLQLKIEIQNEGPKAIIGKLHVNGQAFNTRKEILEYLQLAIGQPISRQRCKTLSKRVFDSGRFLRHSFIVVPGDRNQSEAAVYVDVREFAHVPTLSQELSPEQTVAIRFANWVSNWPKSQHDLVIELKITEELRDKLEQLKAFPFVDQIPIGTTRLIVSPQGGCILQLLPDGQIYQNAKEFHLMLSTTGMIKIDGPDTDVAQFGGKRESSFFVSCVLKGVPKNPKNQTASLVFGIGLGPIKKGHVFSFAPAIAVEALTNVGRLSLNETPTELQLITDNCEVVFDRKTQQPKLLRLILAPEEAGIAEITVVPKIGAYANTQAELQRIGEHRGVQPRKASSSEFFGMIAGITTDWLKSNSEAFKDKNQSWLLGLMHSSIWRPIYGQISNEEFDESFTVPHSSKVDTKFGKHVLYRIVRLALQSKDTQSLGQVASVLMPMLSQAITFKSSFFAFGSPPWIINRHGTLLVAGGSQQRYLDILLTEDEQIGPLACLYGMAMTQDAKAKKRFAQVGLETINRFDLDRKWLLEKDSLTYTLMEVVANAFALQSPDDIKRFLQAFGGRPLSDADIASILEPLDPDRKINDRVLSAFSTRLWSYWFQPIAEKILQSGAWTNQNYLTNLIQRGDRRRSIGLRREAVRDFKTAQQLFDRIVAANKAKSTDQWVAKISGALHFAIARCTRLGASRVERLQALITIQQSILAYEAGFGGFQLGSGEKEYHAALRKLSDVYELKGELQLSLSQQSNALASYQRAVQVYEKTCGQFAVQSEKQALAKKMNRVAWELATSSNPIIRNGKQAVKLATRANELAGQRDARTLATLAAAHATNGDFAMAAAFQRKAVANSPLASRAKYNERLNLYLSRKPFRQQPARIALEPGSFK